MRIEAVTVCWNYADFLRVAAPYNRGHFDRWLIVTDPADQATLEVTRKHNLDVLRTDEGTRGGVFNKGRMVDRGLAMLSADAWRLHIDADIALPGNFRNALAAADLDPAKLYGCDRLLVKSAADWQRLVGTGFFREQHDYHHRVSFPPGFEVGSRWASSAHGYVPIGFFQLSHAGEQESPQSGWRWRPYPSRHNSACRTDVQFGLSWDRRRRELLAEVLVAHLESEPAPLGANWSGRTTKAFEPKKYF